VLPVIAVTDPKPTTNFTSIFMNYQPYGIYLPKGTPLSLVPGNRTDTTRMSISCVIYLMPTFV
jgi:hypothetical protein